MNTTETTPAISEARRFNQALKQFLAMQADRRALEKEELEAMASVARHQAALGASPQVIDNFDPADFGFVCSKRSWQLYCRRFTPPPSIPKTRKAA